MVARLLPKKIISVIVSLTLVISLVPSLAYADEVDRHNNSHESVEIAGSENSEQTSVSTKDSAIVSGDSSYSSVDTEVSRNNVVEQESSADTEQVMTDDDAFEFIYIDQKEITLNSTQNIVVAFVDQENAYSATLYYQDPNEKIRTVSPTKIEDGAALFELSFNSKKDLGDYTLIKVAWEGQNPGEAAISTDKDSGYSFVVVNDSSQDEAMTVYSINENGELAKESNIGEAIEEADGSTVSPLTRSNLVNSRADKMVIALDPGHGGSDPGAVNGSLIEKTLNLKIAQYCRDALCKYSNVEVFMTRSTDEYVDLEERVERAVDAGADVFVSFHINSTPQATGFEVWIQNDSTWNYHLHTESAALGNSILSKLEKLGLLNRGNKENDAYTYPDGSAGDYLSVLRNSRYANLPAVLIEHGFINGSAADQRLLSSESGLRSMGEADAEGIAEYYGLSTGPQPYVCNIDNDGSLTLGWDPIEGAEKYAVAIYKDGKYSLYTKDLKDTSYTIPNLPIGESCSILVQAYVDGRWTSDAASERKDFRIIPTPTAKATPTGDGELTLSWEKVPGATNYAVAKYENGKYTILTSSLSADATSYTVSNLGNSYEHQFLVQAKVGNYWSSDSTALLVSGIPEGTTKPGNIQITETRGAVVLSWDAVPGATKYAVSTRNADGTYNIRTTSITGTTYTLSGLTNGVEYPILVQAYVCGHWNTYTDDDLVYATPKANLIMGKSTTTVDQMVAYYEDVSPISYPSSVYKDKGAPTLKGFCTLVYQQAESEGVRAEVLFCQAMKETGWLRFGGDVQPNQCNFCGLGATGDGAQGVTFPNVQTGLLAQAQHLKAYASTDKLNNPCVDPRFNLITRGTAPYVEWLGQQENPAGLGWATSKNYGNDIVRMMDELSSY